MHGETGDTEGRVERRRSRGRILLGLVPLALFFAALAPSPAAAQDCDGTLERESDGQAALEFECDFAIPPGDNLQVRANKQTAFFPITGEDAVITCPPADGPASNEGEPNNFGPASDCLVVGTLNANATASGTALAENVCDPLELRITAEGTEDEDTFDLNITGCPSNGGGGDGDGDGGGGGGADGGPTPQGGVQSGSGGTAGVMGGSLLPIGLGLILAGTLGIGALALARRRA